jgi:hypothetical protein
MKMFLPEILLFTVAGLIVFTVAGFIVKQFVRK